MYTEALLTDLYELTMAAGYFDNGKAEDTATFELYFRSNPFQGGYSVAAGLEDAIRAVVDAAYTSEDLSYLRSLKSGDGSQLLPEAFLKHLAKHRFSGEIWAVPEGTVVFPNEPLLRVSGRLIECQLVETIVLCYINFQTLVATKAARIWEASRHGTVVEFGLRRAQGPDGALGACRAAFIGGVEATSNVLGAALLNMPAKGTHAHSWVQAFPSELEAFRSYSRTYPSDCILLVDTYNTLESGMPNAIRVAKEMEGRGDRLLGVRIDSGDLAFMSRRARSMLNQAGFDYVKIIASNELDEHIISAVLAQGGEIDIWGVGTKLITGSGKDGCALGGVYKIVEHNGGPKIKLSNNPKKTTNPGVKRIIRFYDQEAQMEADALASVFEDVPERGILIVDPNNPLRRKSLDSGRREEILERIMKEGKVVYDFPSLGKIRSRLKDQLCRLNDTYRRLSQPHEYKVGLTRELWNLKEQMLAEDRN